MSWNSRVLRLIKNRPADAKQAMSKLTSDFFNAQVHFYGCYLNVRGATIISQTLNSQVHSWFHAVNNTLVFFLYSDKLI